MRNSYWSPRPEVRPHLYLYAERRTPPLTRNSSLLKATSPSTLPRHCCIKRDREEYSDGSSTDSAHTDTYYENSDMAGEFHSTALSPESPPEYEKGLKSVDYIPKSSIYPNQMCFQMPQMKTPLLTRQIKMLKKTTQIKVRRTQDSLREKAL